MSRKNTYVLLQPTVDKYSSLVNEESHHDQPRMTSKILMKDWSIGGMAMSSISLSLSVLTAIFQVNLGYPVFIEAKDDGGGGDNWTT